MNKRLMRSNDRVIAGVCGGIAEYLDFDPGHDRELCLEGLGPVDRSDSHESVAIVTIKVEILVDGM